MNQIINFLGQHIIADFIFTILAGITVMLSVLLLLNEEKKFRCLIFAITGLLCLRVLYHPLHFVASTPITFRVESMAYVIVVGLVSFVMLMCYAAYLEGKKLPSRYYEE